MGGPDGKIFSSRSWRTDRVQRGPCAMTNLETNVFEVFTREAVRFCSRAVGVKRAFEWVSFFLNIYIF